MRDFEREPRRVVVQMDFFVYDGVPRGTLQELTESVVNDDGFQEMVLTTIADVVEVGMALNEITVTVHDK